LEPWVATADQWTHVVQDAPALAYYGTGGHEHWAVQAQCTAFAALAVLATAPELDETRSGCSRETLRTRALQLLRYLLATHKSGSRPCVNGQAWGYSWISGLGFERCTHGIAALRPWLTADDQARLRALMVAESDFLLDGYPVVGAIASATGQNKPESNIWNGSLLYRTALLYPDAPHVAQYREKATALLLNGISLPQDAADDTRYAGAALREWHVGPNFTEQYGLNHHGYLNLGYMVICLSNIAMLHFFCQDYGIAAPPELYHHAAGLWRLVKSLTFADGRLWRIGGDTRVRYCYCQDYAVPMWVLAAELWHDGDAEQFAAHWRTLVATEQASNADEGFLRGRLASLAQLSPLYYCRLEGDRAATLSMAAYWTRRQCDASPAVDPDLTALTAWHDPFHGAAMVRGKRLASWVWHAAELPCGTVVPADRSDLVEWQWNLAGRIRGAGCALKAEVLHAELHRFDGGFLSAGRYHWLATHNPAEGTDTEITAQTTLVFAVLPDDATVIVLQQARTCHPVYLTEVAGLYLNVPNDVYNQGQRRYRMANATRTLDGAGGAHPPVAETIDCGETLSIEERINVQSIYGGALALRRPGARRVNLRHHVPLWHSGDGANLYCDLVCLPYATGLTFYEGDTLLYDIGAALAIDAQPQATLTSPTDTAVKVVEVLAADGNRYLLAANLGNISATAPLPPAAAHATILHGQPPTPTPTGPQADLAPGAVVLLRLTS
jgi:hypothetical protein